MGRKSDSFETSIKKSEQVQLFYTPESDSHEEETVSEDETADSENLYDMKIVTADGDIYEIYSIELGDMEKAVLTYDQDMGVAYLRYMSLTDKKEKDTKEILSRQRHLTIIQRKMLRMMKATTMEAVMTEALMTEAVTMEVPVMEAVMMGDSDDGSSDDGSGDDESGDDGNSDDGSSDDGGSDDGSSDDGNYDDGNDDGMVDAGGGSDDGYYDTTE